MSHAGLPVIAGTKLVASRWIRQRPADDPLLGFGQHEAEGYSAL
jgi:prolyl 4-hydroxylase